jgi:hypothetical protein
MFSRIVCTVFFSIALIVVARAEAPVTNRFEPEIVAYSNSLSR